MQMALLFNQYCSASTVQAEPLGGVDWANAGASMADSLVMAQLGSAAAEQIAA